MSEGGRTGRIGRRSRYCSVPGNAPDLGTGLQHLNEEGERNLLNKYIRIRIINSLEKALARQSATNKHLYKGKDKTKYV